MTKKVLAGVAAAILLFAAGWVAMSPFEERGRDEPRTADGALPETREEPGVRAATLEGQGPLADAEPSSTARAEAPFRGVVVDP